MNKKIKLGKLLLAQILLISTIATALFASISFYLDYTEEIELLENSLNQIESGSISGVSDSLFLSDLNDLKSQIDILFQAPAFANLTVYNDLNTVVYYREKKELKDNLFKRTYPLIKKLENSKIIIGTLEIVATKQFLYERIRKKVIYFFFTQGIKTLFVSFLILLVFHKTVVIHLTLMAKYLDKFDPNSSQKLELEGNRKFPNEIDQLSEQLNSMVSNISSTVIQKNCEVERAKKDLQIQQEKSLNSSRLASLGEMSGGIAHEINNPLAIISGHNNMIVSLLNKGDIVKNKEAILYSTNAISKTVKRITDIVKGLLTFARDGQNVETGEIDLGTLLKDVSILCQTKIKGKGISFNIDDQITNYQTIINGNKVQLGQVFICLLNNAVDAIADLPSKWISITCEIEGGEILVKFIDSGSGIDKEISNKILDPFFTTKPVGKGTGLGLSVSSNIIDSHKGSLYVDQDSENTCFVVKLHYQSTEVPNIHPGAIKEIA